MVPAFQLLALIVWANAAPVLVDLIARSRAERPLDGGRLFVDGRPWLGSSKTWRGLVASVATTPPVAAALGMPWWVGLLAAAAAMSGDLLASFIKRRLGRRPSESAAFLDQVPEALIPALVLGDVLSLTAAHVAFATIGFILIDLLLTPFVLRRREGSGRATGRSTRR